MLCADICDGRSPATVVCNLCFHVYAGQAEELLCEDFVLPINEFAVMKAKLTVWISQAVQEMQQSKPRKKKILQCCEKTGYWMRGRRRDRVVLGGSGKS